MGKKPPAQSSKIDVFEDDDLNQAQALLSGDEVGDAQGGALEHAGAPRADKPADEGRTAMDEAAIPEPLEGIPQAIEPTDAHLKFRVRQSTRARFDSFKADLSCAMGGVRLADSNVGRAVMDWFLDEVSEQVLEAARSRISVQRPPSDDRAAMEAFDRTLRDLISGAIER